MRFLYLAVFGTAGVISRYLIGEWAGRLAVPPLPYSTLAINVLGSFLIGVMYVLGVERAAFSADLRIGLMVGFLGGFTTFSSFSLETVRLIEDAEYLNAGLYFCLSPVLSVGGAFMGVALVRALISSAS